MPSLEVITVLGVVVLAGLVWFFVRTLSHDRLDAIMKKRAATAKLVTPADYVEGGTHIPVVLALDTKCLYYENVDLQASVDLDRIEEVEYDDELATGSTVQGRVLRLRSHGHTFEFILDAPTAARWTAVLPPHLLGGTTARATG
jgi:hypothetical protein